MKSTGKKAVGCGIAASFVMMSAFTSEASEALNDTDKELLSVGMIAGEIGIDIQDVAEAVEESKEEAATEETQEAAEKADAEVLDWEARAMADINNSLNVRADADRNSDIVGVVYKGGAVDIIEEGEEWTLIRSGEVEGYVATEYLAFDEAAEEIAARDGRKYAVAQTDGLRVRKGPGTDESIIGFLNEGSELEVEEETEDWIRVIYQNGSYYISAQYAQVEWDLDQARTVEEIEQERKEEEARKAEAARKAAEAAEQEEATSSSASTSSSSASSSSSTTDSTAVSASTSDLQLLAAIIECEAGGESYDGKVAVGAVVMNRVRSGSFPDSISGVIYQSGQFTPASSGKLATVLSRGAKSSCVQAAQDALNGSNNVGSALYFRNASAGKGTIIGNHCFY